MTVNYVTATFDGKKRRFELRRHRIAALERAMRWGAKQEDVEMGASAYAAMRRFHKGGWTADDIELTFAYAGETPSPNEAMFAKMAKAARLAGHDLNGDDAKLFNPMPAIERDGHAAYAALAETILRAALMGIEDDEAEFDSFKQKAAA
ncbi:hypothetical protein [Mesorhizobium sp. CN2-181]|uniref:hypothetical protein n=1 Tax=Mesorhizobium yinganensis TaxID=3157707 RepID=UPI0032B87026